MHKFPRVTFAAFALSLVLMTPAGAADQATVKVSLIDVTAIYGPGGGSGAGYRRGNGMMGRGYDPGYGMMGQGMMGRMSHRANVTSVKASKVTSM